MAKWSKGVLPMISVASRAAAHMMWCALSDLRRNAEVPVGPSARGIRWTSLAGWILLSLAVCSFEAGDPTHRSASECVQDKPVQAQALASQDPGEPDGLLRSLRLLDLRTRIQGRPDSQVAAALNRFWKSVQGRAPLIEPVEEFPGWSWVTYLWRSGSSDRDPARVAGGLALSKLEKPLVRLPGTDVLYFTEIVPNSARYEYGFLNGLVGVYGPWTPEALADPILGDPLAARSLAYGNGQRIGMVLMPDALESRWLTPLTDGQAGSIDQFTMQSMVLGTEREYAIYQTKAWRELSSVQAGVEGCVVFIFDGEHCGLADPMMGVPVRTILENLCRAGAIPPCVAVLVNQGDSESRRRDLTGGSRFMEFVAVELLPEVQRALGATFEAKRICLAGWSFGGYAAFDGLLSYQDTFGCAVALSGSFWLGSPGEPMIAGYSVDSGLMHRKVMAMPSLQGRYVMRVGRLEQTDLMVGPARHMRDILKLKGGDVRYEECNGAHWVYEWSAQFGDALAQAFAPD